MQSLSNATARAVMPKKNDFLVNESFICTAVVVPGETVKLNSNGTVSPVTAVTDIPLGTVMVGQRHGDVANLITVQTPFRAIVRGQANAAITCGQRVAALATVTSAGGEKLTDYKTAVATNYVVGQALSSAVDDAEVKVGLYYTPYLMT